MSSSGINISDICLIVHKSTFGHPQFLIRINIDGKTNETVKRALVGDRIRWDEPLVLSYAGNIPDGLMMTITVIETHRLFRKTIVSFEKPVKGLIQSRDRSGQPLITLVSQTESKSNVVNMIQLKFHIEEMHNVLPIVIEDTLYSSSANRIPSSANSAAAEVTGLMSSAQKASSDFEDTWSPFLSQFQIFMGAMDTVAELHPYLKVAWAALSLIPKTIVSQNNRNDGVRKLCEKLNDVYDYLTNAERLPKLTTSTTQSKAVSVLLQQTIECAYFIQGYSSGTSVMKILKGSTIDGKIQEFNDKFDHILEVITSSVTLEINIISVRIAETISNVEDLTLLNEMAYARDAGFISGKQCLPGTRQNMINEILDWVYNDTSRRVLLLSGQAGSGKSAVAHTIAQIFEKQNRLGSLFCFNRSYKDRCNFLFSTISRNMADGDGQWRKSLVKAIQKTTVRTTTDPIQQFEELIVQPAKEVTTVGPIIIIIDALDESGGRGERRPILDLLFGRCSELPANYRIIVTSRPEQDIELLCNDPTTILRKRMGDITPDETLLDIQSYVSSRLQPIASLLDNIDQHWPNTLAKRAEGLFQWAEVACRFIDPDIRHPSIIQTRWTTCVSTSSSSLYAFYQQIISSQPECQDLQFVRNFKVVVSAMIVAREPLSIDALQNIFHGIICDIETMLKPFGSLFVGANNTFTPVRPLHTSLFDFFNYSNNNQFYVDTSDETVLALGCLKLMNRMLCFNMCKLETSHLRNNDIPDFKSSVGEMIPSHLAYTCRFWTYHLRRSKSKDQHMREIDVLMHQNLLFYLEALSLLGEVEQGRVAMKILESWCKDVNNELASKAADTWQFLSDFQDAITESTPHLYISALPLSSSDGFISKQYLSIYPQVLSVEGRPTSSTFVVKASLTKKNTRSYPTRAVFSPQGNYIATGFENGEVWIWDYLSGEILYQSAPSKLHHQISNIVFSPNGELVYCCFCDGSIWIWNIKTNDTIHESYRAVMGARINFPIPFTVSSDGCYVTLHDFCITVLYDRINREEVARFNVTVNHGLFCPSADLFVFMEPGPNIVLWNTRMRTSVATWPCTINCTIKAFSDNYVVVNLLDDTSEIWDVQKMEKAQTIRQNIHAAVLFPDGKRLLSISPTIDSQTQFYTIWDIRTAEKIFEVPLRLERTSYHCLAVSHDSQFASLTIPWDGTIHIAHVESPPRTLTESAYERISHLETKAWLQESRLIEFYFLSSQYYLYVLDSKTMKTLLKVENKEHFPVAVPNSVQYVCIAYATDNRLCLWNETNGPIIADRSSHVIIAISFSTGGDRLIFSDSGGTVKILSIHRNIQTHCPTTTCELICSVPSAVTHLSFSTTSTSFVVAHISNEQLVAEVREYRSGLGITRCFTSTRPGFLCRVAFSANDTFIIFILQNDITIWNTESGRERIFFNCRQNLSQLSTDGKLLVYRNITEGFIIWDIENEVALDHPADYFNLAVRFSNDSARMVVVNKRFEEFECDVHIWELHINKWTMMRFHSSNDIDIVALYGNRLFIGNSDGGDFENLDVYNNLMAPLYEYHQNNSQFGMYPQADHPEAAQLIERFYKSESLQDDIDIKVSEYALTAWHRALFSASSHLIHDQGWMLGPHGELLFWVPKDRRSELWRPCMVSTTFENYTKFKFDKFVHGSRWTECRASSDSV